MSFTLRSFLTGALLVAAHVLASTEHLYRRDRFELEAVIIQGTWNCTPQQLLAIDQAVVDARELASNALTALNNPRILTSTAYRTWFGSTLGDGPSIATLRDHHYQPIMESLQPPSGETAFRFEPQPNFPPNTVSNNSLVFACPPSSPGPCTDEGMVAGVNSPTEVGPATFGVTLLVLCPTFFDSRRSTNKQMIQAWKAQNQFDSVSPGFALVHEVQHMLIATGPGERAEDLPNPFFDGNTETAQDCYNPSCCSRLPVADKARNAQNFAIFALDVTANPVENEPADPCEPGPTAAAKIRRQISPPSSIIRSNWTLTSRLRPSSASGTRSPTSSVPGSSSSQPGPILQPPTSTSSSAIPSSSSDVVVISGGATVVVPVGGVAFGGPGGGFASFGGIIVAVAAGQTVRDPSSDSRPSNEVPTRTQDRPSTTSSAPTSSSSCPPPPEKSYPATAENLCEDLSGKKQAAFAALVAGLPNVDWAPLLTSWIPL
ncbi:hypothetical protein LY78DRAFT_687342 [Colletotrichum sublineola]|nr:hypothetical protein LY78DRAFT_687342 [Colletotrichum sublineola]